MKGMSHRNQTAAPSINDVFRLTYTFISGNTSMRSAFELYSHNYRVYTFKAKTTKCGKWTEYRIQLCEIWNHSLKQIRNERMIIQKITLSKIIEEMYLFWHLEQNQINIVKLGHIYHRNNSSNRISLIIPVIMDTFCLIVKRKLNHSQL